MLPHTKEEVMESSGSCYIWEDFTEEMQCGKKWGKGAPGVSRQLQSFTLRCQAGGVDDADPASRPGCLDFLLRAVGSP